MKMPIESLADLRRVYTPGVANVCIVIEAEPKKARIYPAFQENAHKGEKTRVKPN
jgi:malic enzyme